METLKRPIKTIMAALAMVILSTSTHSQDYEKIHAAFRESYAKEASGEFAYAVEALRNVYDEGSYEINLRLGWLSYSMGNFTESIAYYQKAMSLKPLAIEPRFGMTYPASAAGNWEMVRQQYLNILEIDPMNSQANYYLGMIYYNWEKYEDALHCFERVANLYPFDYEGLLMYAWTHYRLGKLREAKVLFNKVLMNSPDDESATEGLKLIQ